MNITCYDSTNKPIKELTQWDTNRKIIITGVEVESAPVIHFYNIKSDKALVVPSTFSNSSITVSIPNILLQSHFPLIISIYSENDDEGKTVGTACIPIVPKKKPEDYEYVENIEYVSWVKLEQEAKALLQDLEKSLNKIAVAEDGESIIIGDKETNTAITNGFVIYKATKEKQGDGNYNYYYYLINATQKLCNDFNAILQANNKPSEDIYVTDTLHTYYINDSARFNGEYAEDMAKVYSVELVTKDEVPNGVSEPYITNLYGTRFIGETTDNLLKVRVSSIRKSYQNVPDDPNDTSSYNIWDKNNKSYRYTWKPVGDYNLTSDGKIPEDLDCYEIDYTDTWDDEDLNGTKGPRESNFRISLAPELGNYLIITGSIILTGSGNKAIGVSSLASGRGNTSNGAKATTLGVDNYANYAAVAAGRRNKAMNKSSIALGEDNIVNGYAAVALGSDNEVNGTGSGAIGEHLKTYNAGETAVGSYNAKQEKRDKDGNNNPKTVALSVGGGWSETSRVDAMTVYKDGTTKVLGDIYSKGTNITQTAKELKNKTILNLGKLPEIGEVNKLYIDEQDEQWIYKVRKSLNIPANIIPWDGTKSTPKGDGTETKPYQVTTSQELAYAVSDNGNHYYQLMNDIYINDITNPNWKDGITQNWLSIQNGTKFNGHFDGNYYTIYGLYYNDPDDNTNENANGDKGCALFPKLAQWGTATIKNVGMDYTYVNSNSIAGALIGNMTQMTFCVDNCYFGENVWLRGKATACIGAWGQDSGTISNCYSLANQESALGGEDPFTECSMVLANIWSGKSTVKNCYSLNTPIIGRKSATTTIENCYCCVRLKNADTDAYGIKITKEDMTGINALNNMPELGEAYINDYTYPHLTFFVEGWKSIGSKCEVTKEDLDSVIGDINSILATLVEGSAE